MLKVILIVILFINGQGAGVYHQNNLFPAFETMAECEAVAKEARATLVPDYATAQVLCVSDTEVKAIK